MKLIETALALALVYALLSIVASAFKELLEAYVQKRKNDLKGAVLDLLGPEGALAFLRDPRIRAVSAVAEQVAMTGAVAEDALRRASAWWPSYIEPQTFALVVQAVVQVHPGCNLALALAAPGLVADRLALAEDIYKQRMERVMGSFKRNAQWWLLGIGFVLACAVDADSLHIARALHSDDAARAALVKLAENTPSVDDVGKICPQKPQGAAPTVAVGAALLGCIQEQMPSAIGWSAQRQAALWHGPGQELQAWLVQWALAVLGYVMTAVAISMGAPFWFDLISKVSNVRSTLKPVPK